MKKSRDGLHLLCNLRNFVWFGRLTFKSTNNFYCCRYWFFVFFLPFQVDLVSYFLMRMQCNKELKSEMNWHYVICVWVINGVYCQLSISPSHLLHRCLCFIFFFLLLLFLLCTKKDNVPHCKITKHSVIYNKTKRIEWESGTLCVAPKCFATNNKTNI